MNQSFDQRQHGARIGTKIGFEIEFAARQQDGDAMIADRAGKQNLVANAHRTRIDSHSMQQAADAGGGDVHLVGFTVFDDFGVAPGDADSRVPRGFCQGANFRLEHRRGQPGFEHKSDDQGFGTRARYRQIVHRAVHREFANRSAGKAERLDYKAVSRDRDGVPVDIDVRGISQGPGSRSKKQWREKPFDQFAAGLTSGSVRHLDLGIAKPDGRRLGIQSSRRLAIMRLTRSRSGWSPLLLSGVRSCDKRRMILPMTP